MTLFSKYATLGLLLISTLSAHEHWLFTESSQYSIGDSVVISLRSGHSVGESEFLIDTKLIQNAVLIHPDNTQEAIQFVPQRQAHIATFQALESGSYAILVNLRKRSKGPSIYLMKTQVQVGSALNTQHPIPSQELEIIKVESDSSFSVFAGDIPVKVPLTLLAPDGSERSLIMDRSGKSRFTPHQRGLHVLICHFRRQTASYSLYMGI